MNNLNPRINFQTVKEVVAFVMDEIGSTRNLNMFELGSILYQIDIIRIKEDSNYLIGDNYYESDIGRFCLPLDFTTPLKTEYWEIFKEKDSFEGLIKFKKPSVIWHLSQSSFDLIREITIQNKKIKIDYNEAVKFPLKPVLFWQLTDEVGLTSEQKDDIKSEIPYG